MTFFMVILSEGIMQDSNCDTALILNSRMTTTSVTIMKMWYFIVTPFLSDYGFCLNWICCENVTPLQNTPCNCTTAELGVVWSLHISSVLLITCFSLGLVLCFSQAICSSSHIKHVVWKKCDTNFLRRDMPFDFWFCPAASGSSRMWQWFCGRWRRVWLWVDISKCSVL